MLYYIILNNIFIITLIIISFSNGLDSATNKVIAVNVPFEIVNLLLLSNAFLLKYNINKPAAIRLHPSINGWSFIIKYNRLAAFSSNDLYTSIPKAVWLIEASIPSNCPFTFSTPNSFESLLNLILFIKSLHSS